MTMRPASMIPGPQADENIRHEQEESCFSEFSDARENVRRSVPLTPGTAGEGPVTF